MKKTIWLIILSLLMTGCFEKDYSNAEIIADLDQRMNICNTQKNVVVEVTLGDLDNNSSYCKVGTSTSSIYYDNRRLLEENGYVFKSNPYWKDIFGDEIELKGVAGAIYSFYAKTGEKGYAVGFSGLDLFGYKGITLIKEGQYKIVEKRMSYLLFKDLEGSLFKKRIRDVPMGHRMIMYQVDINFNDMTVGLKMLAYKTWKEGKLIEEKYFY